jgi:DNA-binding transcriptional LysR family regulator
MSSSPVHSSRTVINGVELRQLHYFVTLAEELHFGRAAERLHIVQPAVSQQLRRLEAELGVTLVDRSTRRVALTPAGQAFLPEARAVLAAARRARDAVARPAAGLSTVRLGTSTGLGERLPRLLAAFQERAPGRAVEMVRVPSSARLSEVADGSLDAALVRGVTSHPGLRVEPVWTDMLAVALPAGHSLVGVRRLALAQLRDLPVRLPDREANTPLVDLVTEACRATGFEPRLAPAMNDQDMLAAIAAGPPTWTVYYAAQAELLAPTAAGVAFRTLTDPPLQMSTVLAVHAGPRRPELDALLAACRAVA